MARAATAGPEPTSERPVYPVVSSLVLGLSLDPNVCSNSFIAPLSREMVALPRHGSNRSDVWESWQGVSSSCFAQATFNRSCSTSQCTWDPQACWRTQQRPPRQCSTWKGGRSEGWLSSRTKLPGRNSGTTLAVWGRWLDTSRVATRQNPLGRTGSSCWIAGFLRDRSAFMSQWRPNSVLIWNS